MKKISVSTNAFAAIWSNRIEGEETENEILERLLLRTKEELSGIGGIKQTRSPKFPSRPRRAQAQKVDGHTTRYEGWLRIVVDAFDSLGPGAHQLSNIYAAVKDSLPAEKLTVEKIDETVRGTIYDNCPTSERFKHTHSVFRRATEQGRGYWELIK